MKRPDNAAVAGILIAAVVLLFAGCDGTQYLQSTVDPKSDFASSIHQLYIDVFWWTMGILVLVWGALAYTLFRFRERPGDPRPEQHHGNMSLEVAWTIAPAIIVVLITIPTIRGLFETQRPISDDALTVEVTGKRFFWHFYYPEFGITTSNELVLPVDRAVNLRLESADPFVLDTQARGQTRRPADSRGPRRREQALQLPLLHAPRDRRVLGSMCRVLR